jgi:hypothetical protein
MELSAYGFVQQADVPSLRRRSKPLIAIKWAAVLMSCHLIMPAQANSEILGAGRLGVLMI